MPLQDDEDPFGRLAQGDEVTASVACGAAPAHIAPRGDRPPVLPPVLLGRPDYGGTVAAVRDLGRGGIAVSTLACASLSCANCSKYVSQS